MKKLICIIAMVALLSQVLLASPYDNPYNQIMVTTTLTGLTIDEIPPVDYTGDPDYLSKVKRYNFSDVSGQDRLAAIQLAMFDVTKGTATNKFGTGNLKNIEALTMLIRMFGNAEQIRNQVITANPGVTGSGLTSALNDAYYQEAKNLGIILATEEVGHASLATREQVGVWLVRASGLAPAFGVNALYKATDWNLVKAGNLDAIETVVDQQIMSIQADGRFNPKGTISRTQFARSIDLLFDQFTDTLGVTPLYGIVIGSDTKTDPTGQYTSYYVRNMDNQIAHIQVATPKGQPSTGLSVYKGSLTTHQALKAGDEIEYLVKDGMVKFVNVLPVNQVKDRLFDYLKTLEGTVTHSGFVVSNSQETLKLGAVDQTNRRVRVELTNDAMIDLLSVYDNTLKINNNYLLIKGQSYMAPSELKVNDRITIIEQEGNVLYAYYGEPTTETIKGTLRYVDTSSDPAQVILFDYQDRLITLQVHKDARVSVNFYPATLKDLKVGSATTLTVLNNQIMSILSDSYQPIPGYIPNQGKIKMAKIQSLSGSQVIFKDDTATYEIGPATVIMKDGVRISKSALKVGDQVKLYFDNIYTKMPSKVEVEGQEQVITKILKGVVDNYNQFTAQVDISGRSRLQNTVWKSETDPYSATYTLANDVQIRDGGKPVTTEALKKSYQKKEAYFVIRNQFGRNEIVQMVFKSGYEKQYVEAIKSYSNVLNRMELKNNKNISYNDDTLFILGNRLVDRMAIKNDAPVVVVANQVNGVDQAQIVKMIGNFETIYDRIRVGVVEDVNSYSFALNNYSKITDYVFDKVDQSELLLGMSEETWIRDITKDKLITRETFFHNTYSREENDSTDGKGLLKERYYGIVVTDGNNHALAAALRFKGLIPNDVIDDKITSESLVDDEIERILKATRLTVGTISEFNEGWKRIYTVDAYDYLNHNGEWTPNKTGSFIELTDAIIIKGDRVLTYKDLKLDDRVYILRYDEDAWVVFVEE